jgi:glutamate racemase
MPPLTIGVFDSGFGGLTVLRALLPLIPNANYIYLGDTARLPYGSKSHETIARYAVSSAKFLHEQGVNLLVIACNTATALALEDIQHALPIPVIGVVEPGAHAALSASVTRENRPKTPAILSEAKNPRFFPEAATISTSGRVPHVRDGLIVANVGEQPHISNQATEVNGVIPSEAQSAQPRNPRVLLEPPLTSTQNHVLVLATTATIQSHAYTHALNALGLQAYEKACPLLVPLVEEGWTNHPVTDEVLRIYLTEALTAAPATQTLLLGCTHYPLLEPAIRRTLASMGHPLTIIDSAHATAHAVAAHPALACHQSDLKAQSCLFYATDSVEKFQRLGSAFLGHSVTGVRHIDLGG